MHPQYTVSDLIVYEPSIRTSGADLERFEESLKKLEAIGKHVNRIPCKDISDIPSCCEAHDLVSEKDIDILPITDFMGTVVFSNGYPDDQTLVDYLDIPNGILSVDRKGIPAPNDLAPACSCGTHGASVPK